MKHTHTVRVERSASYTSCDGRVAWTVEGDITAPFDAHNVNTSQRTCQDEVRPSDEINQRPSEHVGPLTRNTAVTVNEPIVRRALSLWNSPQHADDGYSRDVEISAVRWSKRW